MSITPTVAIKMAAPIERGQGIPEKHETEHGDLHRLRLDVGDRHHERAFVHCAQHECSGEDLGQRAEQDPRPIDRRRVRQAASARQRDRRKKQERERKTKQEADVGCANRAQRTGQLALQSRCGGSAQAPRQR